MHVNVLRDKIYVAVSRWAYPGGGGEAFLRQTLFSALELDMHAFWLCFSMTNNVPFENLTLDVVYHPSKQTQAYIIHVPGGFTPSRLVLWLRLLQPDVVHHQGHDRDAMMKAVHECHVPFMTGYHFWDGAIDLHPATGNRNILQHIPDHRPNPEFDIVHKESELTYVVSEFVQEVIQKVTGKTIANILYPTPMSLDILVAPVLPFQKRPFVTMINCHEGKGGRLLLELLKTVTKKIPFQIVFTERCSEALDLEIQQELHQRSGSLVHLFQRDIRSVYRTTRILLVPSIVDETFCRVAAEGLLNKLPIITTGAGFIGKMVQKAAAIVLPSNNPSEWKDTIERLYDNEVVCDKWSKAANKVWRKKASPPPPG